MHIWWKDSEVKVIDGRRFMVVYEFAKYPRYMESVNQGKWYDVDKVEVNDAIAREMEGDRELERHYEMERQGW